MEELIDRAYSMIQDLYGSDVINSLQVEDCGDGSFYFDFIADDKDAINRSDIETICNDNNLTVEAFDVMPLGDDDDYPVVDVTMTVRAGADQFAESNGFGSDGLPEPELAKYARFYTKQFLRAAKEMYVWDDDEDLENDILYTIQNDHKSIDQPSAEWIADKVMEALYDEGIVNESTNKGDKMKRIKESRKIILTETDPDNPIQTQQYPQLMDDIVATGFPYNSGTYFNFDCEGCGLIIETDDNEIADVLREKWGFAASIM